MISNSQVPNCKISSLSVYVYFIARSLQMPTIDLQSCRFVYSWFNHPGWVSYINPLPLENTVILAQVYRVGVARETLIILGFATWTETGCTGCHYDLSSRAYRNPYAFNILASALISLVRRAVSCFASVALRS